MRAKAFNAQIFLELLCYCFFGGLMLYLVRSGKYLSYVTPRMEPYLCFAAAVMLIWVFAGIRSLFRPQHIVRSSHCFVLAIPVLLLLLPHKPLNASAPSGAASTGRMSAVIVNDPPAEDADRLPGLDVADKKITISDENFGMWISEIYMNMKKYEGYTVVMTGFIFKDPELLKGNEFIPARLMMSCCVADVAPSGLICTYDKASELENDSWVTIEGTCFLKEYESNGRKYNDPRIKVTKITPAEAVEGYAYPY